MTELPLEFEHYQEGQHLVTQVFVDALAFIVTLEGESVTVNAKARQNIGPPYVDGPGPIIPTYQGNDPAQPDYDPARLGDIVDGFDKPAWFAAQTIEITKILVVGAPAARIAIPI